MTHSTYPSFPMAQDLIDYFEENGSRLISMCKDGEWVPVTSRPKTTYRIRFECAKCRDTKEITMKSFQRTRCVICDRCKMIPSLHARRRKVLDFDGVVSSFQKEGWTVLSNPEEYVNSHTDLMVRCDRGHDVSISLNHFSGGRRCKRCLSDSHRLPMKTVVQEFEKRNLILTVDEYIDSKTPSPSRCKICGKIWMKSYAALKKRSDDTSPCNHD